MDAKEFTVWCGVRRIDASHPAIAAALEPIRDGASWRAWRVRWRETYKAVAADIRASRVRMKHAATADHERSAAQSRRHSGRVAAANMMLLLEAAKARRPVMRKAA